MIRLVKILKWLIYGLAGMIGLALVAGRIYQTISESKDLARHPAPGKLVAVDERLMHIHCIGSGSPTIVFELGIGSVAASWHQVHKQSAELTRSCTYDRAGLGYSEPSGQPARSSDVARRLHALLQAAAIDDSIVLVGWSAGGIYVREYFRLFPENVRAMLLVDSSHEQQGLRLPATGAGGADPALKVARLVAPFGLVRLSGIMHRRVDASSAPEAVKAQLRVIYHQSHMLNTVYNESEAFNFDIQATQPPAPLGDLPLIVLSRGTTEPDSHGAEAARKLLQEELAALSTDSKLIVATRSGHHIYADQPELVVASIRDLVHAVRSRALHAGEFRKPAIAHSPCPEFSFPGKSGPTIRKLRFPNVSHFQRLAVAENGGTSMCRASSRPDFEHSGHELAGARPGEGRLSNQLNMWSLMMASTSSCLPLRC